MKVTKIENSTRNRYNVYIDEEFVFRAYKADLTTLEITEGDEVSKELLDKFYQEVLGKRAKKKAMDLLIKQDRCEKDLYDKLVQCGYPTETCEQAIEYVKKFGYINDERYVMHYIESNIGKKSVKQIEFELKHKEITKELIQFCFDELTNQNQSDDNMENGSQNYLDLEGQAIQKILQKKLGISSFMLEEGNIPDIEDEKLMKTKMYLYRKGYPIEKINKELDKLLNK